MADMVGQRLGNYRLVRLIGRGGFAQVYLGEHFRLGTQAAIKLLSLHLPDDDVEPFLAEARLIAHLEHPHIIRILVVPGWKTNCLRFSRPGEDHPHLGWSEWGHSLHLSRSYARSHCCCLVFGWATAGFCQQ